MFSNPGTQTKIGGAMGISLIPRFWSGSTKNSVNFLVFVRGFFYIIWKLISMALSWITTLIHFHHEDGKEGKKFSPCERKFVCQHEMARDCKIVIQPVNHILHGWCGEGRLPKFYHNFHLMFWKVFTAILWWREGENFPFFLLLKMKVRSDTKPNVHNTIHYCFCIFQYSKCEKIISNVTKQNLNNNKFLSSMGSDNFFLSYVLVKKILYSHFLCSITLTNFHQTLKVRIVLKSEFSWHSKNIKKIYSRCLRCSEIAIC